MQTVEVFLDAGESAPVAWHDMVDASLDTFMRGQCPDLAHQDADFLLGMAAAVCVGVRAAGMLRAEQLALDELRQRMRDAAPFCGGPDSLARAFWMVRLVCTGWSRWSPATRLDRVLDTVVHAAALTVATWHTAMAVDRRARQRHRLPKLNAIVEDWAHTGAAPCPTRQSTRHSGRRRPRGAGRLPAGGGVRRDARAAASRLLPLWPDVRLTELEDRHRPAPPPDGRANWGTVDIDEYWRWKRAGLA